MTGKERSLSAGHRQAIGVEASPGEKPLRVSIVPEGNPLKDRYEALEGLPRSIVRKAWFTLAHLLVQPGATIVDLGCEDGAMAYAMSVMSPQSRIIGVDMDRRKTQKARDLYASSNLEFMTGDISSASLFKPVSIDAIVNSFVLHEIYSGSFYNNRTVVQSLTSQMAWLRPEGLMYIRDFAMPSTGEFVLMEMPDVDSKGPDLDQLSEADLLVWYSEHARPRQDPGCTGFFLEELPPRFPRTRLFRLPSKWAYEFIMRKDEREIWQAELPKEYTFFTDREFRRTLRSLGARVLYTAPHWDDQHVKAHFDGHFRLYSEDGKPLGSPPTSCITVAQKSNERHSLRLNERRPSQKGNSTLRINAMRNDLDGRLIDVISREISLTEILPYRITEAGELNVFVHHGVPRGIVNAVPRNGRDLDGKRWSGHMTEAIAVNSELIDTIAEDDAKSAVHLMRDMIGLKPLHGKTLLKGPYFYPAPDFIDERIETRYIEVEQPPGRLELKAVTPDLAGFQAKGVIMEMSAQAILNAISVGIVPNAQLELQILALYEKLGMKAESWSDCPLALKEYDVPKTDVRDLLAKMTEQDDRYRTARGSAGQWKALQSIFVDEGHVNGSLTGLASRDIDFAVSDETTENIAVVLPLVKNMSGETMVGYVTDYLPVPQRYKGSGFTVSAPMLPLPRDITTMDAARQYIADHFKVKPEHISRMGESFFCHIGITPQRVYPFAMTAPFSADSGVQNGSTQYSLMRDLWMLLYWDNSRSFMKTLSIAYKNLGEKSDLSAVWDFSKKLSAPHSRPVTAQATDMRGLGSAPAPAPSPATEEKTPDEKTKSVERQPLLKQP